MKKKIIILLIVTIVAIQFFRPVKNQSNVAQVNSLATAYSTPLEVKIILEKACNDCHTNNTTYPWYNNIQPIAWWLARHVSEGKKHLNFDELLTYQPKKQDHKMEEVIEMVKEKEMPLPSYTWTHTAAKLSNEERVALTNWASVVRNEITAKTGFVPKSN